MIFLFLLNETKNVKVLKILFPLVAFYFKTHTHFIYIYIYIYINTHILVSRKVQEMMVPNGLKKCQYPEGFKVTGLSNDLMVLRVFASLISTAEYTRAFKYFLLLTFTILEATCVLLIINQRYLWWNLQ